MLSSYLLLNHRGTAHRPRHVENTEKFYLRAAGAELSGSIYTQVTDLETELNGLRTYDRTVIKVDPGPVRAINERVIEAGAHAGDLDKRSLSASLSPPQSVVMPSAGAASVQKLNGEGAGDGSW